MTEYPGTRGRPVRYGDKYREVLRSVLHSLYKSRCYWCGRVKEFADIEVDHIIPQSLMGDDLRDALRRHDLPPDFDQNDVANLAPICGQCNGPLGKGGQNLTHLPVVASHLVRARKHKPEVVRRAVEFVKRGALAKAFVTLNAADIDDPKTRKYFAQYMPTVVRKLAAADGALADFALYRAAEVEVAGGEFLTVPIELQPPSRRAAELLEDLGGVPLHDVVTGPITDLWGQIHDRVHAAFEESDDEETWGPTNAGPPTPEYSRVELTSATFTRIGPQFEFVLEGEFGVHLTASLVRDNPYGWETTVRELQGDAAVHGTFSIYVTLDLSGSHASPHAEEATIETWTPDVWITETG